jgi:hypothetical protein
VLPVLTLTGSILQNVGFSAAFNLPVVQLDAELQQALLEAYRTWVLNTRLGGLTEYTGFEFNSFAQFNGMVLAAGTSGVVVLGTQDLDGATAITMLGRTGKADYGESMLKRVPRLYVGGRFTGDLLFRTITSEDGRRTYSLPYNQNAGLQQRRVPIGKGPKAVYWQYEFENVAGADAAMQRVLAYPSRLRRRIQ